MSDLAKFDPVSSARIIIEATRQFQRYTGFGVPVWFVYGMEGARLAIDELKERWSEPRQREKSRLQGA